MIVNEEDSCVDHNDADECDDRSDHDEVDDDIHNIDNTKYNDVHDAFREGKIMITTLITVEVMMKDSQYKDDDHDFVKVFFNDYHKSRLRLVLRVSLTFNFCRYWICDLHHKLLCGVLLFDHHCMVCVLPHCIIRYNTPMDEL